MKSQMDVARKAGVSFMTVSRVINGHKNVKKETREKVLKAIEELAYYPNAAARALTSNRTNILEVVIPHEDYYFSSEYFTELLFGIDKVVKKKKYNLIFNTYYAREREDYSTLYRQRKVDGLLVVAPTLDDRYVAKLCREEIPFVLINGRKDEAGVNYVDVDNVSGAETAINYLLDLGHRRVGFISGKLEVINGRDRLEGYRRVLKSRDLPVEEELIFQGNWSEENGYEAFSYFLKLRKPPTAIFCSNDLIAIGAIRAAKDHRIGVPEDISIIGFDDIKLASYITPRLTTIRQPIDELGKIAARIMLELLSDRRREPERVILQPELIVRNSCKTL